MDITPVRFTPPTNPSTSGSQASAAPATELPPQRKDFVQPVQVDPEQLQNESDKARLEAVQKAASTLQRAFPEFETFTIFKNNSGEFVTRITNRTSGTVSYVPEQNILQFLTGKEMYRGDDKVLQLNV